MKNKLILLSSLFFATFIFAAEEKPKSSFLGRMFARSAQAKPNYPAMPQDIFMILAMDAVRVHPISAPELKKLEDFFDKDPLNIEATDKEGSFPLLHSAIGGEMGMFNAILKRKPQINRRVPGAGTALHMAIDTYKPEKVQALLVAGADKTLRVKWHNIDADNYEGDALQLAQSKLDDLKKLADQHWFHAQRAAQAEQIVEHLKK